MAKYTKVVHKASGADGQDAFLLPYIFTECALCFDRTSWEDGSVEHGYVCTPVAEKDADYEEESFKDCVHHEGIVLV